MMVSDEAEDFAEQHHRAVLLQHALRLGGGGGGVDRVFREQVDLLAQNAARRIDLLRRELCAQLRVAADHAEKAGQRCQMPDPDLLRLGLHDGGKPKHGRASEGCARLQQRPSAVADHVCLLPGGIACLPSKPAIRYCERPFSNAGG
jgi:hypothetical protein